MTALTMVIGFTPAAVTWLVQLVSSGKAQTPPHTAEASHDAVADALKDLNKTLGEGVASMRPPEAKKSGVGAADFVGALVEVVQKLAEPCEGATGTPRSRSRRSA